MFKVWSEISEAYKVLKIAERFTNITINQFTNGEKPWSLVAKAIVEREGCRAEALGACPCTGGLE